MLRALRHPERWLMRLPPGRASTARSVAAELRSSLAEALLPQRCVACDRFGAALHEACLDVLPRAEPPRCDRCWAPLAVARCDTICSRCVEAPPALDGLRTPFVFGGAARRALLEAKFAGVSALLAPLAREAAVLVAPGWAPEAVAAVPLHPARERRRGYNQAAIAAAEVARLLDVPAAPVLLRRVRATDAQARLHREERVENVRDAFAVAERPGGVPRAVLLVDDVTTTGATLGAAAEALRAAGVRRVWGLALARED